MFSVLVFADNTPMPQDTPNGFPAPAGPPPPPPLPIDNNILWLMLLGVVFVFYLMNFKRVD